MFGCPIDALTLMETEDKIVKAIENKQHLRHAPVDARLLVAMQKDVILRESILSCDIINADGQAVVWASKFLGTPLPGRAPATTLMQNLDLPTIAGQRVKIVLTCCLWEVYHETT